MTEKKIAIQQVMNNLKREIINPSRVGGQSCGLPQQKVKFISEELNISVEVGYHRSQLKNSELARTLIELAAEELLK